MKINEIFFEILLSEIDCVYFRLNSSTYNIIKMVDEENENKNLFNPLKHVIIGNENNNAFIKFHSTIRGLNNFIYFNSLILTSYSIFEYCLKQICFFVEEHFYKEFKFENPSTEIIIKCIKYLNSDKSLFKIETQNDKILNEIKSTNKLRNLIAHNNSNLIKNNKKSLIKQNNYHLFKSNKNLFILENGQIYINNPEYIENFISNSEQFLKETILKLKNNNQYFN